MPARRPAPGDLEPIETASRDAVAGAAIAAPAMDAAPRLRRTRRTTARCSTAAGFHPNDLKSLADLARLPFTTKQDLREDYPFGLFAVPREQVVRIHASSGTTGKPTVVGYTRNDIDVWATRDGALDPRRGRPPGRHRAHRLRLRVVHRRPGRALRRREARLHGHPDVRRA